MNFQGFLLTLSAALSAGASAYISNFHPVSSVAALISTIVTLVAYLAQSPIAAPPVAPPSLPIAPSRPGQPS